jgi:hypothetical protein
MKKTLYLLFTATVFTALLLGCGKETQSSTQGGGLFKFKVTITPPLQGSAVGPFQINSSALSINYLWTTGSPDLSVYESQEYSVTKGQNISVGFYNTLANNVCYQVKVEGLLDNKVFKSTTLELGYKSIIPTITCKDGTNQQVNFIIP